VTGEGEPDRWGHRAGENVNVSFFVALRQSIIAP